jgi:hypothetical protein
MSRRKAEYTTRDPKPSNREPVLVVIEPDPEPVERQHPPIIRIEIPRCTKCNGSTWLKGGTTVPNVTTAEMLRWRSCANCRTTHYFARPMEAQEKDRYCAPERVVTWDGKRER